ncbi:MAG: hypothetical protein NT105_13575 [Verrucomicrobia bacterium]|nr:hypothetical protein [Verrucomicrobiota bacterium]
MNQSKQVLVCKRRLAVKGRRGAVVTVQLFSPIRIDECEWRSRIRIEGTKLTIDHSIPGLDAFHSLTLALQLIKRILDSSGLVLTWEGGERGDHGFRRSITDVFGFEYALKLESLVAEQDEEHAAKLERQYKLKHRRSPVSTRTRKE